MLTGIILCGGNSTRMGSDKGLLKVNDLTWAEQQYKLLESFCSEVYVSVNAEQKEAYAGIFQEEKIIEDSSDFKGPAKGIFSGHNQLPNTDLLVLACDMIDITEEVISALVDELKKDPKPECLAFSLNNEAEPLCAIYTNEGLDKILRLHQNNQIDRFAMRYIIDQLDKKLLKVQEDQIDLFKNYNEPTSI